MKRELAKRLEEAKAAVALMKEAADELRGECMKTIAIDPHDVGPDLVLEVIELSEDLRTTEMRLGVMGLGLRVTGQLAFGSGFDNAIASERERRKTRANEAAAAAAIAVAQSHASKAAGAR